LRFSHASSSTPAPRVAVRLCCRIAGPHGAVTFAPPHHAVDSEALLTTIREKHGNAKETLTQAELKDAFLSECGSVHAHVLPRFSRSTPPPPPPLPPAAALGYDKVTVEEDADDADAAVVDDSDALDTGDGGGGDGGGDGDGDGGGGGGEKKRKEEVSKHAEATWDALLPVTGKPTPPAADAVSSPSAGAGDGVEVATSPPGPTLPLRDVLIALHLAKAGYGEPSLRFAVKLVDPEGTGALTEAQLWWTLTKTTNLAFDYTSRCHLRKAVRDRWPWRVTLHCKAKVRLAAIPRAVANSGEASTTGGGGWRRR